jgi:hypothetical protein
MLGSVAAISALLVWIVCCNCKYTSAFPTQLKKIYTLRSYAGCQHYYSPYREFSTDTVCMEMKLKKIQVHSLVHTIRTSMAKKK